MGESSFRETNPEGRLQQLGQIGIIDGYELGFVRLDAENKETLRMAFRFFTQFGWSPYMAIDQEYWESFRDKIDKAWNDDHLLAMASKEHMDKMMDQPEYEGP